MQEITAAIIIIGNEILSGKTQDANTQFLATELAKLGIHLKEVRIIADIEQDIIEAVNFLCKKYTYVFSTGGIGPTHDDITAASVAKAFAKEYKLNEKAKTIIEQHIKSLKREVRPDHLRMAYMPESAEMLLNHETGAPGFKIENLFVMAGVPYIMQSIFQEAKKFLKSAKPIISKSIDAMISEGSIAKQFGALQAQYPQIEMGSYPFKCANGSWGTNLCLRGTDEQLLDKLIFKLEQIIQDADK